MRENRGSGRWSVMSERSHMMGLKTHPCADVDFTMKFRDLLTHSVVRFLQDSAAENDSPVRLEVFCGNGWDSDAHLLAVPDNQSVQGLLLIHHV